MCSLRFDVLYVNLLFQLLIVTIVTYNNTYQDKDLILKEKRKKSGIYCGVQIESGNYYIGSSVNLTIRFSLYFNYNHLSNYKHNMAIYKALSRYGYTPFRLEILEYCSREKLIEREQLYLDKCKPKYNILKLAGSSVGFKHSEASKELMSQLAKGRLLPTETLLKMKERTLSLKVKLRISAAFKGRVV